MSLRRVLFAAALGFTACAPNANLPAPPPPLVTDPPAPPPSPTAAEVLRGAVIAPCKQQGDYWGWADAQAREACSSGSVLECRAACEGGNPRACRALAAIYREGKRVPRDAEKARVLVETACKLRDLDTCLELGHYERVCRERDVACLDSKPPWLPAGLPTWGSACHSLARENPAAAEPYFVPLCEEGSLTACLAVAEELSETVAKPVLVRALTRLCKMSSDPSLKPWTRDSCGRLKDLGSTGALGPR